MTTLDLRPGWGILGTGGMAESMATALTADGAALVAVGSRRPDTASAFAAKHGIRAHSDHAGLVDDPDVHIVYIATPHPSHADLAVRALDAGKHVLVEKPFAMTAAEARRVFERADAARRVAMEALWTRWLPHMARARQIVASGVLGRIEHLDAEYSMALDPDPGHRVRNPALGGGALLDLGVYPVSLALDLLGPAELAGAVARRDARGVDVSTAALLRHENGAASSVRCSVDAWGPNRAVLVGTEGRIEFSPTWSAPSVARHVTSDGRVIEELDGRVPADGLIPELRAMERAVAAGSAADEAMPPEGTLATLRLLDAIRAATLG